MPEPRAQDWKGCRFYLARMPPAGLRFPSLPFTLGLGPSIMMPLSPHTPGHREGCLTLSITLVP